jgi:hypothetical protein
VSEVSATGAVTGAVTVSTVGEAGFRGAAGCCTVDGDDGFRDVAGVGDQTIGFFAGSDLGTCVGKFLDEVAFRTPRTMSTMTTKTTATITMFIGNIESSPPFKVSPDKMSM